MLGRKCKKCGKEFYPTYHHIFKKENDYYCSWTCYRHRDDGKPKRKIVIPKVGDIIKIINISGVPSYSNKIGVVTSLDFLGQLHGTWGGWVVVPNEDTYEIIGEEINEK